MPFPSSFDSVGDKTEMSGFLLATDLTSVGSSSMPWSVHGSYREISGKSQIFRREKTSTLPFLSLPYHYLALIVAHR